MKIFFLLTIVVSGLITIHGIAQDQKEVDLKTLTEHPRILLLKGEEETIRRAISENPVWSKMHEAILRESENIIALPVLERIQIGRRLLDKSRECIRRIFFLSYASRMTGEEKYFKRAEKEMLTISSFSDWNPTHFLDVAEMTLGMAIGYDWLFDKLSDESKVIISDAIVKKGLVPSLNIKYNGWLQATHNWNQVCNAGMAYGALAISSEYPDMAKLILDRAINTIPLPMEDYKPDGAYPEGYTYWGYGTSFNVMFLSAIEKAFSTDFDLSQIPGFLETAAFREHMVGATGLPFNWGDCGPAGSLNPSMFWFAKKNSDPSLLWVEKNYLQGDFSKFKNDRLLPAIMIWGKEISLDQVDEPDTRFWIGQGPNPVCLMRSSWSDPNAVYLGFKAGSASVNHGHMDIGSFVMESDGVRWAADFGMQDYESLESKGIRLFGRTQDAQRWSVFRLNNFVHNTLTVNNQLQLVNGSARIDHYSGKPDFSFATSDLTRVYENQLAALKRGVALVDGKYVVVQDELTARDTTTVVRWTMLTPADVTITGRNTATLKKDGKELFLRVASPSKVNLKTWSTQPTTDYDAPNPGTTLLGFEVKLAPGKSAVFQVMLLPQGTEKDTKTKIQTLESWR
ncbi:MAG: heparinase II/III family protein [Cyclobacteriaceae bacterium]